jgi:release factor glutamine methyltransferase
MAGPAPEAAPRGAPFDVRGALREAMRRLREARVPSRTLAAEVLLMHVLGRERAWLYTYPEESLAPSLIEQYFHLVAQRCAGTPTQYLTGRQEFWGLEFEVTPAVLIPRPETEHVVEVALARLGQAAGRGKLRVADVGTGSGCLAVALARELPRAEVFATDVSAAALEVARRNAARHGVAARIHFVQCSLLGAFRHEPRATQREALPFDLVVSNPPYVSRADADALPREVREHEPAPALLSGEHGTDLYRALFHQAAALLAPGGVLAVELGYNSAPRVRPFLDAAGVWTEVALTNDLAGIPRVLAAERC